MNTKPLLTLIIFLCLSTAGHSTRGQTPPPDDRGDSEQAWEFFAFDNGVGRDASRDGAEISLRRRFAPPKGRVIASGVGRCWTHLVQIRASADTGGILRNLLALMLLVSPSLAFARGGKVSCVSPFVSRTGRRGAALYSSQPAIGQLVH